MKRFAVTVEKEIIVEFDESSKDFQKLFAGYKEAIDPDADFESFASSIAQYISRYGVNYLKHNGENQRVFVGGKYEKQEGYVNVEVDTDINNMVDFDIGYIELEDEC